ncbi:MAG: hypothetical protein A3F12_06570 [Gammaproteobacteria bacterium RIFCSPHIGHO2_12_FULL_38_14]|nr:MAG: hypothetical protein A3F12_06570 [Gammaproteobacteria bacterium RIFCSPHIGHO2_12_FULL_38_14]
MDPRLRGDDTSYFVLFFKNLVRGISSLPMIPPKITKVLIMGVKTNVIPIVIAPLVLPVLIGQT